MFTLRLLKIKIHSRRVFVFKRSLPVFAFLLAAVMIAWPSLVEQKDKFALAVPSKSALKAGSTDMEEVRFFSKDSRKNPITVIAEIVRETDSARQIILLEKPQATYKMSDGVVLTATTPFGLAFQQEKYLYFEDIVNAQSDNGYRAVSSRVVSEYTDGTLGSDQPTHIKGPAGMVQSEGFLMKDKGNYLFFKGKTASLIFNQEKPIDAIDSLSFDLMNQYHQENKENILLTSENGQTIDHVKQVFTADKNVVALKNAEKLEAQKLIIEYQKHAKESIKMQKTTAVGNVQVTQPGQTAKADKLIVYKRPAEIRDLLARLPENEEFKTEQLPGQIVALYQNASLKEGQNLITADKIFALYDPSGKTMIKAIAIGHMTAKNTMQRILGEQGVYTPETKIVSVYQNVSLHEKESMLTGDYATLNLKTGISSLTGEPQASGKTGRVKGSLIPTDFKKQQK